MNISTFPKFTCPSFYFWKSDFPESIVLVICQMMITPCLWLVVSGKIICLSENSERLDTVNFHQPRIWVIVCGVGVAAVLIHILFASIIHKGVYEMEKFHFTLLATSGVENRMAYVALWLTYVLTCWTGAIVQLFFSTPWISINALVGALLALLLLPVLCSLRTIQKRKQRNWTLNVHC